MSSEESEEENLFPSTGGDAFSNPDSSDESSESDRETLNEIGRRKRAAEASKNREKKVAQRPKKKTARKKKKTDHPSNRCRTSAYGAEELLLVSKAFMKVSTDAKHATDKKAEKFWDEVNTKFEEFVATTNKINESNSDFTPIESGRGTESIRNCWQRRIQPSVQKFAGIIYNNPPTSGELKDDANMDLYYQRMRAEYAARSHTYSKDMPKTFDRLMTAYHFLSQHPKFEVEFPGEGVKPPPKHPNSIRKASLQDTLDPEEEVGEHNTFVKVPTRKDRPAGREKSKRVDAINLIVDKVTEKTSSQQQDNVSLQNMWLKIENAIEVTSKHMKANIENQIMANAPSPIRKSYFDNLYRSIAAEAETRAVESENRRKAAELEKRELELKQQSIQLREALRVAEAEMNEQKETEVECFSTPSCTRDHSQLFVDNNL